MLGVAIAFLFLKSYDFKAGMAYNITMNVVMFTLAIIAVIFIGS
jgi:hypothetical protein